MTEKGEEGAPVLSLLQELIERNPHIDATNWAAGFWAALCVVERAYPNSSYEDVEDKVLCNLAVLKEHWDDFDRP